MTIPNFPVGARLVKLEELDLCDWLSPSVKSPALNPKIGLEMKKTLRMITLHKPLINLTLDYIIVIISETILVTTNSNSLPCSFPSESKRPSALVGIIFLCWFTTGESLRGGLCADVKAVE